MWLSGIAHWVSKYPCKSDSFTGRSSDSQSVFYPFWRVLLWLLCFILALVDKLVTNTAFFLPSLNSSHGKFSHQGPLFVNTFIRYRFDRFKLLGFGLWALDKGLMDNESLTYSAKETCSYQAGWVIRSSYSTDRWQKVVKEMHWIFILFYFCLSWSLLLFLIVGIKRLHSETWYQFSEGKGGL